MSDTVPHRLFLLDGMALIYRAHYAFINSPIRNEKGLNTSALFGFINTLLSLQDEGKPTHIAVAFDTSEPTDRHKLYPEYKANREAMPEELSAQIPHLFSLLEAFRIPIIRMPGYEADDTIGTLSRLAEKDGSFLTYMVTPDKDFGQLIDERTFMWKPGRKGSEYSIIDVETLKEEWSIERPAQVIDILALMGDSSDNIPGVPGIGPKTAKDLIAQYESVENLLEHLDDLKGKRKDVLKANADKARLSKTLATINTAVPVLLTLDELICKKPDEDRLRHLMDELEFRALKKRVFGDSQATVRKQSKENPNQGNLFAPFAANEEKDNTAADAPASDAPSEEEGTLFAYAAAAQNRPRQHTLDSIAHTYHVVKTEEQRQELAALLLSSKSWCFDTETTGLDPLIDSLLGISFALVPGEAYYVLINSPEDLKQFLPVFAGDAEKIGHNLKFDLSVMRAAGVPVNGPFFDTMLAHSLLAPGHKHSMDYLAETLLSYTTIALKDIAMEESKGVLNMRDIPEDVLAEYAAEDADVTLQLARILRPQLEKTEQIDLYRTIEAPLIPVLSHMEYEGININAEVLSTVSSQLETEIDTLRTRIVDQAGHPINLNSPKQLGTLLFDELQLIAKPKKTKTGQYVTDEETLSSLAPFHPIVADILSYREAAKLKGTYVDALPRYISTKDHRIHTQFLQLVTVTGRMASQDPNLQNIPIRSEAGKGVRAAFIPRSPEYTLLSADYSQIELRVMAALSGDQALINAFKTARDIHTETAALLYGISSPEVSADMRRAAKTVNFGIIYGISAFGLSQRLGIPRGKAAEIIESYFAQFPGVKTYMDSLIAQARENGYVSTLNNRRRSLPDINSANGNIRQGAERMAINTPIQGTAADMIKLAMIRVHDLLETRETKSRLLLQIHDELLFDLHHDEHYLITDIVDIMRNALPLPNDVPILVEANTGRNWLEAH